MDPNHFTKDAPGEIVEFKQPLTAARDFAFIPKGIPPKWGFDASLWPLLAEARESLGTLNGIGQTLPSPQLLLRPLQTREALSSSSIEGTYVTAEQLLLFELDPHEPPSAAGPAADWLEVFNYGLALQHGCSRLTELPLCNRLIREMHGILMRGVRGRRKSPGEFRSVQVQIGSSGRFIPPPAREVNRLMANLEKYMNASHGEHDPLVRCFIVHYQFEAIHPFADGNGRVGRTLLALMVYKLLRHTQPWLYLSPFFERFRNEYMENLFRISTDARWSTWIEFCLRATIAQSQDSIARCHRFTALRSAYHDRLSSPTPRSHMIVESLFASPIVTTPSIQKRFQVAFNTARRDIDKLLEAGILKEVRATHPAAYCAPEVMRIAYGDPDEVEDSAGTDNDQG